jgi:ribosomal protein L12E/L44/L45/RPP1/RPP2
MNYQEAIAGDARFYILRELGQQVDGHLNEVSLRRVLDAGGIRRSREWIATQLRKLEELDAITISQAGDLMIAHIAQAGRDHIAERSVIVGITRPSEIE